MINIILLFINPLMGYIRLLGDYELSTMEKINIYIQPVIVFLINLYNNIKKIKLHVIFKLLNIMPSIKPFIKHLWHLIIAFIKNMHIQSIIMFLINLCNNIKKVKLYAISKFFNVMPRIKLFIKYFWPLIIAFIKYYVKKYYYTLIKKKYIIFYIYKEAWNLYIQLHKITHLPSKPSFIYRFIKMYVIAYLTCIFFIITNYFYWKIIYTYFPRGDNEVVIPFDVVFLEMCREIETYLAS